MKTIVRTKPAAFVLLSALCFTQSTQACAVCMGANDSLIAPAINAAIFLMLGIVGFMMLSVLGFMFYLARRANSPTPPHQELSQALASTEETMT